MRGRIIVIEYINKKVRVRGRELQGKWGKRGKSFSSKFILIYP